MKTIIISSALFVLCQNVHAQSVPAQYGRNALPTLGTSVSGLPTKLPTHVGGSQMYPQITPVIPNVVQMMEGIPEENAKTEVKRPSVTMPVKKDEVVESEASLIQRIEAKNASKIAKEMPTSPTVVETNSNEGQAYYPDWPSATNGQEQGATTVQASSVQAPVNTYGKLFK